MKPISFDRFLLSLEKYKKRLPKSGDIKNQIAQSRESDYIFVKSGCRTLKINLSEILYLEALSDYVAIFTKNEKILTLETLRFFEKTLPENQFIRVHRYHLVSISKIDFIERNRIMINNQIIPISRTYQADFWEKIGKK